MSVLIHALAVHDLIAHAPVSSAAGPPVAGGKPGGVPDPAPAAPPGLASRVNTLLAWWKWGSLIAGVRADRVRGDDGDRPPQPVEPGR
jgi:hypothetical protein